MSQSLPCVICNKSLDDAIPNPTDGNQPSGGLEFTSPGHYGSTVFDMDPGRLVVNICDHCIKVAGDAGRVRRRVTKRVREEHTDSQWSYTNRG